MCDLATDWADGRIRPTYYSEQDGQAQCGGRAVSDGDSNLLSSIDIRAIGTPAASAPTCLWVLDLAGAAAFSSVGRLDPAWLSLSVPGSD